MVETFYEIKSSVKNTYRKLRNTYCQHNRLFESIIKRIVEKFYQIGSVKGQRANVVVAVVQKKLLM